MTREQDWRIHEYMGNDLTGYEWATDDSDTEQAYAIKYIGYDAKYQVIPHYSTTWEGFGLITKWLKEEQEWRYKLEIVDGFMVAASIIVPATSPNFGTGWYAVSRAIEPTEPQALAKAYIAAMEERDNG